MENKTNFLDFFKNKWPVILEVVGILVIFLTDIIKAPSFSKVLSEANTDVMNLTRFMVLGISMLLITIFELYKISEKAYLGCAIFLFTSTILIGWQYKNYYRTHTAFNSLRNQRYVIGDKYQPEAQLAIADKIRKEPNVHITPKMILEEYNNTEDGNPDDIWYLEDIEANARSLIVYYLFSIFCGAVFLITAFKAFLSINDNRV